MSKPPRKNLRAPSPAEQPLLRGTAHMMKKGMSPEETARYIAEFSAELSFLARRAKLDLLAYLLDMARLEAIRTVQAGNEDP
jgi:hypothetical protein